MYKLILFLLVTLAAWGQYPEASGIGGGGGGASAGITYTPTFSTTAILSLPVTATNTLTVGVNACGAVAASTFTVASGTGTLWIALASDCTVVVRHNVVGACTASCTAVASSSGFLQTDLPLYEWVVTAGVIAATGTNKLLPNMSVPLVAGANVTLTTSGGVTTISAASTYDPSDPGNFLISEDFPSSKGTAGTYAWVARDAAVPTLRNSEANHPGIIRMTNGGAGTGAAIDLNNTGDVIEFLSNPFGVTNWTAIFVSRPNNVADGINIGYYDSGSFANYLLAGSAAGANWLFRFCSASCGGGASSITSGVAFNATDWAKIKFRSVVLGTVLASISINGGAYSTEKSLCAAACDASGTVPIVAQSPVFYEFDSAGTVSMDIDGHWYYRTGIAR